jgi:hypothetical protein
MMDAIGQRLRAAVRDELGRSLGQLCASIGAAESSILMPAGDSALVFFASNNPVLMGPGAPAVPTDASFTGLAFRTGQTIAFADASGQEAHNKTVDEHVGFRTREFAAIPIQDQHVVGVLTLVNRPPGAAPRPFDVSELRQATALALELAPSLAVLANLTPGAATEGDGALDPALIADLAALTGPERQIVHSLAASLQQIRGA